MKGMGRGTASTGREIKPRWQSPPPSLTTGRDNVSLYSDFRFFRPHPSKDTAPPTKTDPIRTYIRSLSVYSHTICICAIGPTPCCTTTILASKYPTRSPILAIAANTCAALNGVSMSSIPITCICTKPCLCVKISTGSEAVLPPSLSRCVAEKSDSRSRSTVSSTPRSFLPRLTMMMRLLSGIT